MISLAVARDHLRVETNDEDLLITEMIHAATRYIERRTGWYLGPPVETVWHITGDGSAELWLPQPVEDVDDVTSDTDNEIDYTVRGSRLIRTDGRTWLYGKQYAVETVAGFREDEGPADLRHVVRLLLAGWFEDREGYMAQQGVNVTELPHTVSRLLHAYERVRS
jgi:uncharacterized phiE125 gp8 family phage protein